MVSGRGRVRVRVGDRARVGHVAVARVEPEHLLFELGVPQRLPAVLSLALVGLGLV